MCTIFSLDYSEMNVCNVNVDDFDVQDDYDDGSYRIMIMPHKNL